MKPVDQDEFGKDKGNCFQACVASILELDLHSVPHFCSLYGDSEWFLKFSEWLTERGLGVVSWECKGFSRSVSEDWADSTTTYARKCLQNVYWIGSGPNVNGVPHSTVWKADKMVHDPNPNYGRSGIALLESQIVIVFPNPRTR
jgi:hypothetical protein